MTARSERQWTGRHVLVLGLAFFGIVFAANGVMVYLASSSWTGLETEDAYRKGLAYNRVIERGEAQAALGWRTAVALDSLSPDGLRLTVSLNDRDARPLDGRTVAARLRSAQSADGDVEIALQWVGAGQYAADLVSSYRGRWEVRVEVDRGGQQPYLIETRLWPN